MPAPGSEGATDPVLGVVGRRRAYRLAATVFVVLFAGMVAWSLATPLSASPDEPAQVAHAAAVVRGQLVGTTIRSTANPYTSIRVPEIFSFGLNGRLDGCFVLKPTVPASCAPKLVAPSRTVRSTSYVDRYPPLYFAIVGLPSLVVESAAGIYLMRVVSSLLSALLLALAFLCVLRWSTRRTLLLGILAAATPMTWFLASVVNPNGFEITSALCLWVAGTVLVLDQAGSPPAGLVAVTAASAVCLVLSRGLSPLWGAIILVVLALLGGWTSLRSLLATRSVQWAVGAVVVMASLAVAWIVNEHALDLVPDGIHVPVHTSTGHLVATVFGYTGQWLVQMVGVFGSLDTYAPTATYLAWAVVLGTLVLLGLGSAGRRRQGILLLLMAAVVVVPVAITVDQAHRLGIDWQGRYVLPLAVGVPVVAAALLSEGATHLVVRISGWLTATITVGGALAFVEALRRYTVGTAGPIDLFQGSWQPPGGDALVVALGLVALGALGAVTWQLVREPAAERAGTPR